MAWLLRYLGHIWHSPEEKETLYLQALAIFKETSDEKGIADILYRLGMGAIDAGEYQRADSYLQDSMQAARSIQRQEIILNCLLELGNLAWVLADYQAAESQVKQAQLINEEFGYESQRARAQRVLARVALSGGNHGQAEQELRASMAIYEELGLQGLRAETLGEWAEVTASGGNFVTARELAQESLAICEELDHQAGRALPLTVLGEVAMARGDLQLAKQEFQRAVQNAMKTRMPAYALHALGGLTRLSAAQGDIDRCFQLAAYLLNHPSSWQWTRDRVSTHLISFYDESIPEPFMAEHGNWVGESMASAIEKIFGASYGK